LSSVRVRPGLPPLSRGCNEDTEDLFRRAAPKKEFLEPLGLSANALAMDLHVPVTRISEILHERRSVTADTALRLGTYFGTSPQFWLNLQMAHDLSKVEADSAERIAAEVRPRKMASVP
jgi:addiction module HigA family antidote